MPSVPLTSFSRPVPKRWRAARTQINGWQFYFGRHRTMRPIITSGRCKIVFSPQEGIAVVSPQDEWQLPLDPQGRFLRRDGKPLRRDGRIVSIYGRGGGVREKKPGAEINFWHYVLGLDGSLLKTREIMDEEQRFFSNFLIAVEKNLPFAQALKATIGSQGTLTFSEGERKIPCPVYRAGYQAGATAFFVPARVANQIALLTFDLRGKWIGEFTYDADQKLFYYENGGTRVYFTILQRKGSILEIPLLAHSFRFVGRVGEEGEVFKIAMKDGKLVRLTSYLSRGGHRAKVQLIGEEAGVEIISVGKFPVVESGKVGAKPKVRILKERHQGRIRYGFCFGRRYYLAEETVRAHDLREGNSLTIEPLQGQACAIIDDQGRRTAFVMDWLWQGENFVLDHTSPLDIVAERMSGYRVLEQTEITFSSSGGLLTAGGRHKPIVGYLPWGKTGPVPLSVLVIDGGEVLFFRDTERFSEKDWKVAELIVKARERGLNIEGKPETAGITAKEAAAVKNTAEADILEAAGLERAYDLYLEAFTLNPTMAFAHLKAAMELRGQIIIRKKYLGRRVKDYRRLKAAFSQKGLKPKDYPKVLAKFIGATGANQVTTAYLLEIIAGIAEGRYEGDRKVFQKVFASVPQVLDLEKFAGKRLLLALRILSEDPNLRYLTRYVLTHPPAGKESLFRRRREQKLGIHEAGVLEINWLMPPERKIGALNPKTTSPEVDRRTTSDKGGNGIPREVQVLSREIEQAEERYRRAVAEYEDGSLSLKALTGRAMAALPRVTSLLGKVTSFNGTADLRGHLERLAVLRRELVDFQEAREGEE